MHLKTLRSFYLLPVLCHTYLCGNRETLFQSLSDLDGKICDPVFTAKSESLISCGISCIENPNCHSFFHAKSSSDCTGCNEVYTSEHASSLGTASVPDTRYHYPYARYQEECSDVKPCIDPRTVCYSGLGTCVCDPTQYVYSPSAGMCVEEYAPVQAIVTTTLSPSNGNSARSKIERQ